MGRLYFCSVYIAALCELCKHCRFDAMDNPVDEMIRDQLIEKTNSGKVLEKLLMEQNLTLDNAISIATSVEVACKDAKALGGRSEAQVNQVAMKKTYICCQSEVRFQNTGRCRQSPHMLQMGIQKSSS